MLSPFERAAHGPRSRNLPRRRRSAARPRAARLRLEPMEDRLLLSFAGAGSPPAAPGESTFAPNYRLFRPSNGIGPYSTAGPTGLAPTQVRHAYGFDQIAFPTSLSGGYN